MEKSNIFNQSYVKNLNIIKFTILIIIGAVLGYFVANFSFHTLIILGAGLVLLVFVFDPAKFLLFYLATIPLIDQLIPLFTSAESDFKIGPNIIIRGGLTLLLAFYWLINKRNPMNFWVAKPIFIFIALIVLSILYSNAAIKSGFIHLTKISLWMILIITVSDLVMQKKMCMADIYKYLLISVILFVSSLIFTQLFYGKQYKLNEISEYGIGDFGGFFTYHSLSVSLSMGFVLILFLVTEQRNFTKLIFLLSLAIITLISILKTYVRTGYLCFTVGIITFSIMLLHYAKDENSRYQRKIIIISFLLVLLILTVYTLTHTEVLQKRFSDTTGSGRKDIWRYALNYYIDSPLINKIIGSGYIANKSFYKDTTMGPHNGYIFFLLEAGIVGLFIYLWLFFSLWRQIKLNVKGNYSHFILSVSIIVIYLTGEMTNGVFEYPAVTSYLSFIVGGTLGHYLSLEHKDNFT